MKVIANGKYSQVYYDEEKDMYIKYFTPKLKKKIKYFLKLRKYPGENCKYISNIFNKIGIKTPEIIKYDRYLFCTKGIEGKTLKKLITTEDKKEKIDIYIEKYIYIVSKVINNKIYYADFNFSNFILFEDELYILDLEDYKKDIFFILKKKKMLRILKEKILKDMGEVLIKKGIDYEKIYKKIYEKIL